MSTPGIYATGRNRGPAFIANTPFYYPLGGDGGEPTNLCISEANAELVARESQTLSRYTVNADARSRTGVTTYNVRKNEANAGPAISVSAGLNGIFADTVSIIGLVSGDRFCQVMSYDSNTGTVSNSWTAMYATGLTKKAGCYFQQSSNQSGAFTRFGTFSGSSGMVFITSEAAVQLVALGALTVSNLYVEILTNTHAANATAVTFRKNGANGNGVISVPASTTGAFEDTTHTDTLSDLDKYCWQWVAAGSGNMTFGNGAALFTSYSDGSYGLNLSCEGSVIGSISPDLTGRYSYFVGALASNGNSLVSIQGLQMPTSGISSNLWINILANTSTTAVVVNVLRNNVAGNQALSIGAGLTGVFRDTTHTDSFSAGDQLLYNVGFSTTGQPTASGGGTKTLFYYSGAATLGTSAAETFTPAIKKVASGTLAASGTFASTSAQKRLVKAVTLATNAALTFTKQVARSASLLLASATQFVGGYINELEKPAYPTELIPFGIVYKSPNDSLFHVVDWSSVIPPGKTISLAGAWIQSGDVGIESDGVNGLLQTIQLFGGTVYSNFVILRAITIDGQDFSRTLQVVIT